MFSIPCRPCLSISARGLFCRIFFVKSIHKFGKQPPISLLFSENLSPSSPLPGGDFLFSTYFTKSICIAYYLRRFHSLLISSRPPRRRGGKNPARQGAVLFPPENRQKPPQQQHYRPFAAPSAGRCARRRRRGPARAAGRGKTAPYPGGAIDNSIVLFL